MTGVLTTDFLAIYSLTYEFQIEVTVQIIIAEQIIDTLDFSVSVIIKFCDTHAFCYHDSCLEIVENDDDLSTLDFIGPSSSTLEYSWTVHFEPACLESFSFDGSYINDEYDLVTINAPPTMSESITMTFIISDENSPNQAPDSTLTIYLKFAYKDTG